MPLAPTTDAGTAVITGLAAALATFMTALPSVIGALLLLAIGWIVAGVIGGALARFLRTMHLDELAERTGVIKFLQRAKVSADPAGVIGGLVKWYVRLVFVVLAADAVGLTAVSGTVNQVLGFIPNLLVAILMLGLFSWLATTAKNLATGGAQSAGLPNARAIGVLTFVAVLTFGIVAAANQIGVASSLINILFMGVVGGAALAFGLAFGLGGRDQAAEIWAGWRRQAQDAMQKAAARNPGPFAQGVRATDGTEREPESTRRNGGGN